MKAFITGDLHLDIKYFPNERPILFPKEADVYMIAGDCMNGYKSQLVDYLIQTTQKPILTVHGHSHHYVCERLDCDALLYSNPRGYDKNIVRQELIEVTANGCRVLQ